MIQRDFVLRQIAQLTQALARVLFLRRERRAADALQEIQTAGEQFLGLDLGDVRTIAYADLAAALEARGLSGAGAAAGAAADVAELLRQRGELDAEAGRPEEALHSLGLSLRLYLEAFARTDVHAPDHIARIDALLARIAPLDQPRDVLSLLFGYYETTGRRGRAEDVLFVLAERPEASLRGAGLAFYDRLRRMTNAQLAAGGLSREEVFEGREAFERLFEAR